MPAAHNKLIEKKKKEKTLHKNQNDRAKSGDVEMVKMLL